MKKDYCTLFPEYWFGTYIGDCCYLHDEDCGTTMFFNCLISKIDLVGTTIITIGGLLGCIIKYPKKMLGRLL